METLAGLGFNSLQTGKHIQSENAVTISGGSTGLFQFPSNGKTYTKSGFCIFFLCLNGTLFQFPSNGKAYTKTIRCRINSSIAPVSIPFKRETIYKADVDKVFIHEYTGAFQFPSNGKAYTKGKRIGTAKYNTCVSIPFKRETIYKGKPTSVRRSRVKKLFQFPSNGKPYTKNSFLTSDRMQALQFQFPSNGKPYTKRKLMLGPPDKGQFQFPSNGKAYTKPHDAGNMITGPSEEFQFPSNGKPYTKKVIERILNLDPNSFNSLQTGKHIQRYKRYCAALAENRSFNSLQTGTHIQRCNLASFFFDLKSFNSLQTGKHIQSYLVFKWQSDPDELVSIPFKRESISKVVRACKVTKTDPVFQFPSNGKAYPKQLQSVSKKLLKKFQFPSNGKAYPKEHNLRINGSILCGFNSLQTGKHIQSHTGNVHEIRPETSFNSLQTGKHIQSGRHLTVFSQQWKRFNSLQTGKHIQR